MVSVPPHHQRHHIASDMGSVPKVTITATPPSSLGPALPPSPPLCSSNDDFEPQLVDLISPLSGPPGTGNPDLAQPPSLEASAARCAQRAADYAYETMQNDGHWRLETKSSISFTVQWLCIRRILGPPLSPDECASFRRWILSHQNAKDGSWGLAPAAPPHEWPGDVSITTEAYLGLKLLGTSVSHPSMRRARAFVLREGGVAKVGVLTQLVLAMFGIIAWRDMAQVPAELVLLPPQVPYLNIYSFSYWSRVSAVAVMLLRHYQPVWPLQPFLDPNDEEYDGYGDGVGPQFIDELFLNPTDRRLRNTPALASMWRDGQYSRIAATLADKAAGGLFEPLLRRSLLRSWSLARCTRFIIDHLDEGGYGSLTISNFLGTLALHAAGFQAHHPVMKHLFSAMEVSLWEDKTGKSMQVTVGPVWDTALMALGLLEIYPPSPSSPNSRLDKSVQWIKDRQVLATHGDYHLTNPAARQPGGWSFQYCNSFYPDCDDTLVCLLTIMMGSPEREIASASSLRAVEWLLAMQCSDGGWAAYDKDNYNRVASLFPFADGVEFFDCPVPDITGRVLELFGWILSQPQSSEVLSQNLVARLRASCERGLEFLARTQETQTGSWWSRWHVNHINGTTSVLCALEHFKSSSSSSEKLTGTAALDQTGKKGIDVPRAISWLKSVQNADGGWGESLDTYHRDSSPSLAGTGLGISTATQTAWAIMALVAHLPPSDAAVEKGVEFLVRTQVSGDDDCLGRRPGRNRLQMLPGATWQQPAYTSVGFPNTLWLEFGSMRHGYPMMALGRYLAAVRRER